jgi:nucleoside-diphosphate-sugar epimerase
MNVLVTGGAGFLGGYAISALTEAGHKAVAYDIAPPAEDILAVAPELSTGCRHGSVTDLARLIDVCRSDRIEAIVHTAGRVGLEPSLADPPAFYQANVMGLVNVCEAARQLALRKVIAISSNAAYHQGNGDKLVETAAPFSVTAANPAAHYGTSKMAGEAIGMAYAQFQSVDFLALRVTAIYGFGMRSPMYIKPMVENSVLGKPTRFETGGPMKRDYTHVLDCCRAIVMAIDAPRLKRGAQRILNIAAGRTCTATEIAAIVRRLIPGADIAIGDGLSPLEQENVRMRAPLDISAAKLLLGWSPQWPVEDGIRQYADRFRDYINARSGHPRGTLAGPHFA